ncbi:MAG: twin-arginine translocase subunit TatC [Candidatus Firestonebacteria bacterium]|nr:twin-arginine translocase subunit TatC [Candidatus Firestonebacteria bacterium]
MTSMKNPSMTIIEHLNELRYTIIISLMAIIIGTSIAYYFSQNILKKSILILPYLVCYSPLDGITIHLKLAFFFGIIFAIPVVIGEFWKFLSPGLYKKEKKYLSLFIFITISCFLLGTWTAYNYIIPLLLKTILSSAPSWLMPMISAHEYIKFLFYTTLLIGFLFEILPLSFLLAYYKICNVEYLKQYHRIIWIFLMFLTIQLLGLEDIFRLIIVWLILGLIYEIMILLIKFFSIFIPGNSSDLFLHRP